MALDETKLENISRKPDGKLIARCPACAAEGHDSKGDHLSVLPDGRFTCVVHQQDKAHRQEIFKLVGLKGVATPTRAFSVEKAVVPASTPIVDLGRFSIENLKIDPQSLPVAPPVVQPEAAPAVETPETYRDYPPKAAPAKPRTRRKSVAKPYVSDDPVIKAYDEMMARSGCMCADTTRGATAEEIAAFLAA